MSTIYTPKHEDVVDMFLTQHFEDRMAFRFPGFKFKDNLKIFVTYCESPNAESMWAIPIVGGYVIGKWIPSKHGSFIKGIYIAQSALWNWQFKRSEFTKVKSVQIQFRRVISQTANKAKCGKGRPNDMETKS